MIHVSGLTKYYGRTRAISDLSFSIDEGQIAGFLGLNGAGKSTALKILAGYLLPSSGRVEVGGVDMINEPERLRASIGFLPERPPLYPEMTVSGFLMWIARLRGVSKARFQGRLPEILERTGLTHKRNQVIGTLSLGYRKRLGIAQAICHEPKLVILDEPISGLDPVQIVQMREMIRGLKGDHTVLISSHILPEVKETCDRLLVLRDGELVAQGTEAELLDAFDGGVTIEVTIQGDLAGAEALIRALPEVRDVRETLGRSGTLTLRLNEDRAEAVAKALVLGGYGVRRLTGVDNALEAAFLAVTGMGGGEA